MLGNIFSLNGKVAVVTGGGRGLGEAICDSFAEYGANIAVVDIDKKSAEITASKIKETYGHNALAVAMDITNISEIKAGMENIYKYFGRIDILVNNAGVVDRHTILDADEKDYDRVMNVNVKGTYFCSKEAAKYMVLNNYGKIINIASISSFRGIAERSIYCISKGAVLQATRVMAVEWAKYNIHVNAVAPCYLDTPLTRPLYKPGAPFYEFILRKTPLKRVAKPEEIVGGILYLASDSSDMVTGTILSIDGGWTAE